MKKSITPLVLLVLLGCLSVAHAQRIAPEDAGKYTGSQATVCGKVVKVFCAAHAKGEPTMLDFGRSRGAFTVLIWGEDRSKFEKPLETLYDGKEICATGTVKEYRGRPEMIVRDPSQIKVQ